MLPDPGGTPVYGVVIGQNDGAEFDIDEPSSGDNTFTNDITVQGQMAIQRGFSACDGLTGGCPADALQPSGAVCRASTGACDPQEICDGASAACPVDALESAGTECRASAGGCDPSETCNGVSASCPVDSLENAGNECRASTGVCDPAEV